MKKQKELGNGLTQILASLAPVDARSHLVQRHLILIALLDWVRGNASTAQPRVARVVLLLDVPQARPEATFSLRLWWNQLVCALDSSMLLADYGFASRNALFSEFVKRLHLKLRRMSRPCPAPAVLLPSALPAVFTSTSSPTASNWRATA